MKIPRIVGEVMSRDVVCLTEDQEFRDVEAAMRLFRFRHVPVTEDRRLVGLVTKHDLFRVSASSLLPAAGEQTAFLSKTFRVRDIMTRAPRAVDPETRLVEAARLMQREKLGCLPVVSADNVVVGIVTEADFVGIVAQLLENEGEAVAPPPAERRTGGTTAGPFESLTSEHAVIRRALAALGEYAKRLEAGAATSGDDLVRFAAFFETFAELWHHGKEEDVLLPALLDCGFAWDSGPLARLRKDHDQENYLSRVLSQDAARSSSWSAEDRRHARATIVSFIEFELSHMDREETLLYRVAAERLSPEAIADMARRFHELEARTFGTASYEVVLANAEALFRRYLGAAHQ